MSNKNKINSVTPVVLSGGSGSRLWPLSRDGFPKQFLVFSETKSLFQQAVERINNLESNHFSFNETLIVTNEEHRFLVLDQLRDLSSISAKLILEPVGKNTAPALTLAAYEAIKNGDDPILIVSPADQKIDHANNFNSSLLKAINVASNGAIVVLGIKPLKPESGFGYIKREKNSNEFESFNVEDFIEKPNIDKAIQYFHKDNYFWNSGIFILQASVWLKALKSFRPDIESIAHHAFLKSSYDSLFIRPDKDLFNKVSSESVDFAVIENCPESDFEIKMIELDAGWSDLGSWDAVWRNSQKDPQQNLIKGDVISIKTKNSLVSSSHRLVGVLGVDNIAVIETADAVLVTNLNNSQDIKEIINKLNHERRKEKLTHRKVFRPWGWFDTIDEGERFKVKRIVVNPGASLSLQKHQKRAEHWVVVKGKALINRGNKTINLTKNESTFIPSNTIHRLSNPSNKPLEIIEVQSGDYLEEDDIQRFEDNYGRET